MSLAPKYKNLRYRVKGSYNAVCDRCAMRFAGEQLQTEWTGLLVCDWCFNDRHPADLVHDYPVENSYIINTRQEPSAPFDACAISGITAVSDFAVADCAVADSPSRSGI
jgi:hypothetical protein